MCKSTKTTNCIKKEEEPQTQNTMVKIYLLMVFSQIFAIVQKLLCFLVLFFRKIDLANQKVDLNKMSIRITFRWCFALEL